MDAKLFCFAKEKITLTSIFVSRHHTRARERGRLRAREPEREKEKQRERGISTSSSSNRSSTIEAVVERWSEGDREIKSKRCQRQNQRVPGRQEQRIIVIDRKGTEGRRC